MTDIGPAPTFTDRTGSPQTAQGVFGNLNVMFDSGDILRVVVIDLDTAGNPVPTYLASVFTYDVSNNLETETITNGPDVWVKTFTYTLGNQTSDSGWVKQ